MHSVLQRDSEACLLEVNVAGRRCRHAVREHHREAKAVGERPHLVRVAQAEGSRFPETFGSRPLDDSTMEIDVIGLANEAEGDVAAYDISQNDAPFNRGRRSRQDHFTLPFRRLPSGSRNEETSTYAKRDKAPT